MQFKGKLGNQTWEKGKKTNFGPDFDPFGPNFSSWVLPLLDVRHYTSYHCMQSQEKRMIQTRWNGEKTRAVRPKFGPFFFFFNFFFQKLALSVNRYRGQLSSCTISEKTDDPILIKFSDGQTDRRTRVISKDAARLTSSVQYVQGSCQYLKKNLFKKTNCETNYFKYVFSRSIL